MPSGLEHEKVNQRADVWSRYWATGAQHSCANTFGQRYEGAIGKWWQQVFEDLQPHARVLDVATGSGAVLQLALLHCTSPNVLLEGVDVGQVEPPWIDALPADQRARVHIYSGVSVGRLPFPDRTFDLVTSQFGIEYTDLDQTLAELRRVLCAGGSLRCVLHHENSQSAQHARVEIEHIHWLLAPGGLLQIAEQLCEPLSRSTTPQGRAELSRSPSANSLRQRFNILQDERQQLASASTCPDVLDEASDAVSSAFRAATDKGVAAAHAVTRSFAMNLHDSSFRLADLVDHALSAQRIEILQKKLSQLDFPVVMGELTDTGKLMGWWLKAELKSQPNLRGNRN